MTFSVPGWIRIWVVISIVITIWDASFVLMRPRSLPGGDLHKFWSPYATYIKVDYLYRDMHGGWNPTQSTMNLVEDFFLLIGLLCYSKTSKQQGLIFLAVLSVTLGKTIIYGLIEYFEGFPNIGHNDTFTLIFLWIIPNGIWILVPFLATCTLGSALAADDVKTPVKGPTKTTKVH